MFWKKKKEIKEGSIVEILNLSGRQIENIISQTCNIHFNPKDVIGQRYYVHYISGSGDIYLINWNFGGHGMSFNKSQLRLLNP